MGPGSRHSSSGSELVDLVEALASDHLSSRSRSLKSAPSRLSHAETAGSVEIPDSNTPLHAVKVDPVVASLGHPHRESSTAADAVSPFRNPKQMIEKRPVRLRVLIVEV
jgi:hypothetical protein